MNEPDPGVSLRFTPGYFISSFQDFFIEMCVMELNCTFRVRAVLENTYKVERPLAGWFVS